jgi:hypothetical protein
MNTNARSIDVSDDEAVESTVPPEIEEKILMAFGNKVVVEERELYDMFHVISGDIQLTPIEFVWYLENMEERGFVASSVDVVRSWRRIY